VSRLRNRRAILALLAALSLPAAAGARAEAAGPGPAKARAGTVEAAQPPRPQLLLIHGGAFLGEDPGFQPLTEAAAIAAGFEPHYLSYPLGDVPAAVTAARAAARQLRREYGRENVYAYGSSAGGTLAALLAGDGLVRAAVTKAPVSDLVGWQWAPGRYGPGYFDEVHLDLPARRRLSPLRRPQKRPLLVVQGRRDAVVPAAMSEAFAAKFRRVRLWLVPGGHFTDRLRPILVTRAMRWLAGVASLPSLRDG
jgi:pimeloyl-ACP methyl ester carboxylesterase